MTKERTAMWEKADTVDRMKHNLEFGIETKSEMGRKTGRKGKNTFK